MEKKPQANHCALLNEGKEDEMEIFGYKSHWFRRALCIAGYFLSCGALLLIFYWKPAWDVWANCVPCDLQEADVVLLRATDEFQRYTRKKVIWIDLSKLLDEDKSNHVLSADKECVISKAVMKPQLKVRYIRVQKIRYLWDVSAKQFHRIGSLEDSNTCYEIHHKFAEGLTTEQQEFRKLVCGPNTIEVEISPIWKLLFKEILNPFYVFQAFTLTLWLSQNYFVYSSTIIFLSIIAITFTVYDLRQQSIKLHNLVEEHNNVTVTAWIKDEGRRQMKSSSLVPGDILLLEGQKHSLPCDAILLDGSCIINEGMLTGESVPVTKTALPHTENTLPWKTHSVEDYRRHVLFCGTEVIQTKQTAKGPPRAVVLQTGERGASGKIGRALLAPPLPPRWHGTALCLDHLGGSLFPQQPGSLTLVMALLLLTVPVPPALPAALTTGIIYAQQRLKKKKIFCISPQRINIGGQINLVCFDKTGTLTEDGLDLWGAIPCQHDSFQKAHRFSSGQPVPWGPLCQAMATCHSLLVLEGKIQGDPLDLKMFEGTGWEMEEACPEHSKTSTAEEHTVIKPGPDAAPASVEGMVVLHQFPFSSALQRMSVIVQEEGKDSYDLYMKGAPEMVASFCTEQSVPGDFLAELQGYTSQGFRVIALAHKALAMGEDGDLAGLEREEVEFGLTFLGLLVMENRLKSETNPVLEELMAARIRTVMVTGDNLQTAVTVAKNSGMISNSSKVILVEANEPEGSIPASLTWQLMEDKHPHPAEGKDLCIPIEEKAEPGTDFHFAMTGKSYQVLTKYFSALVPKVLLNGTVFARMSPGQKSSLVEEFQKLNYYVGMCGDGANDCGALKMAHAGISLSEQEASVASPFTSQVPNIQCVPELIREGRASLVSSFAVFKYLTTYVLIQFVGTCLLYWQLQFLGNYQYLFQDIGITIVICLTMSLTHAYPKLAPYRPSGQLLSPPLLLSVVLNVGFTVVVQVGGFLLVKQQPWYLEIRSHRGCPLANQTLTLGLGNETANSTEPHHQVLSYEDATLWPLVTINCLIAAFVFSKGKPFRKPIYTNYAFSTALCLQLGVALFLFFADFESIYKGMEDGLLQNRRLWLWIKALFGFRSSSQYRLLQRQLLQDPSWPPMNRRDFAEPGQGGAYVNPAYEGEESAKK
ncbi:probable cation-transporting ATPase 13A5 [Heteronotia binoei]|uniref:probable cation-transporting ATPase 13A5 n=1 Tax=Heteronotia binoei TaxID=13085 RepID=UPI00292DDD10|nr:probable cation-transporting ATPase 13A5 [Heteronotia binoei]